MLNPAGVTLAQQCQQHTKRILHDTPRMLTMPIEGCRATDRRSFALVELTVGIRTRYYWAEFHTGILFRARDGKCMTSAVMRVAV